MVVAERRTTYRLSPAEPVRADDVRGWWIPDAVFAALRVFIALLMIGHGLQDHFGFFMPRGEAWLGAPTPLTDRWMAASAQLLGGTLLFAGLFTRFAALVLAVVALLAAFAAPGARGHWMPHGGEAVAVYLGVLAFFAMVGGGLFSLDTPRTSRPRRRGRAMTVRMSPWLERQYRRRELTR